MKRDQVKAIFPDATDDQLNAIMNLNGEDVEKAKGKAAAIEELLAESEKAYKELTEQLTKAKEEAKTGEDYKARFEQLEKDVADREAKAKADAEAKEKAARIEQRFNSVIGDKKFTHAAIRADYLNKFGEEISKEENASKSDADVLHALIKDDAAAFAGTTPVKIVGGANKDFSALTSKAFKKMSYKEKADLFNKDPNLYEQLKSE